MNNTGRSVPDELRCNGLSYPAPVDARTLCLSWRFPMIEANGKQESWQIQIATSTAAFSKGARLAWDSGRVRSEQASAPVPPFALIDDTRYYWRVRVWNTAGSASAWSLTQGIVMSPGQSLTHT